MEEDLESMDHFDISLIEREREREGEKETCLISGESIPYIKSFTISECCSFGLRKEKTKQTLYATMCIGFNFMSFSRTL